MKDEYSSVHSWARKNVPKPLICPKCGETKKLEAHNISGEYRREIVDWIYLCNLCHKSTDGRTGESGKVMITHLNCPRPDCSYEWDYKGHHEFYITCPRCLRKFKVPKKEMTK